MVLPAGVNKAGGLLAALDALDIAPMNCVAVGDAENDMAFLDVAGASVTVANAVPALKQHAAWVTQDGDGRGVAEQIDRLWETDLAGR
jgi:hydroxymethylpyrimidine pyrophosphatase-like HAD family hydrolase